MALLEPVPEPGDANEEEEIKVEEEKVEDSSEEDQYENNRVNLNELDDDFIDDLMHDAWDEEEEQHDER